MELQRTVLTALDLYCREQDGILQVDMLNNLNQRKCSLLFLLSIVKPFLFLHKAKKIKQFINAQLIRLKIEEIHMCSQGS